MIIKTYQIKNLDIKKNPFILLYGKNEGLKNQIKNDLLKKRTVTSNYKESEIFNNSDIFFESINSSSLFETEKIITITQVTDKIFNIISELIEKEFKDLIIILDADILEKRSKLRSYFEKSKKLVCIPFYPDTNETLSKLAFQYFKEKNISISSSNINMIIDKCNGDRKILFLELEKIENFARKGKRITTENIAKLINLIENHSISELIDNCLAKNKKRTINILVENNFSNEDTILITRTFLNKLKKLLTLCIEFKKNKNVDLTISNAKPPIFWKEKEITKQQIISWTPEKIKQTLYKINEIELRIKKNYENSINFVIDFVINLVSKKPNN